MKNIKFRKQQPQQPQQTSPQPQQSALKSSINSEIEALTMSYNHSKASPTIPPPPTSTDQNTNANDDDDNISMTDSEKQRVEMVQKTSFISPQERKKRALERQQQQQQEGGGEEDFKVSSSIAKFNEKHSPKRTNSFGEDLMTKVNAVLHKKEGTATATAATLEEKQQQGDDDIMISSDVPPTLSAIEAAVTRTAAAKAQDDSPAEQGDAEKSKRTAIQQVMKDSSLSPTEKNAKIQQIIRGKFENSGSVGADNDNDDDDDDDEQEESSSGEEESSSGEEESSSGEEESSSGEEESSSGEEESSSGEEETSSEKDDDSEVVIAAVEPPKTVPIQTLSEESSVQRSSVAASENRKKVLELQLDEELEHQHALEIQHEQRQSEFRAEQDRLRNVEAAEAAEIERRRRLEEDGQRALELIQRRLQDDREQQKVLAKRQDERRQYEEQRRQLEEEQRRLRAEREHQQILATQREQMFLLQEEQRRLEEQRIRLEEEERRLQKERLREQVQVSQAVGNVERTMMMTTTSTGVTRAPPRSPATKTITESLGPPRAAPISSTSKRNDETRFDGVDDAELNWRLDHYAMLSDYTILVKRALPGAHAPNFEVDDDNEIDFVMDSSAPKTDVYYVHKAMIAVGSHRSELLGRRIREAETTSRPDGHSSDVNVHETIMLESAADAMGIVLDFLYYPDKTLEINIHNAVPLLYLGKRYKIRALIEESEEFVDTHLMSTSAIHFLLDSYLYHLDDILSRSIDVTAAHLGETSDFDPIYQLPPELFRRIILSKDLNCESELLSLIVYSYCGEHHAEDIDVEYLRDVTKQRIMPDIDSKVALMLLKFYVALIFDDDENCDIMNVLDDDNLMQRCITVAAKHWQDEVYEPIMVDSEWDESGPATKKRLPEREPTALHRALPSKLQNYILEKCIIEAKHDFDKERAAKEAQEGARKADVEEVTRSFDLIVRELQNDLNDSEKKQNKQSLQNHLKELEKKTRELETELETQKKIAEAYKQELKRFRRVPGIHNFGEVSTKDPKIIDKTRCTYSANPEHHFPYHRRGDRPPTQMPSMTAEFENLAKENGYIYDDGHGDLLPVFYYFNI